MTQRIFFDCDTGIDDSVALLLLLGRADADLMGIASTAGNVPADVVAANNLSWLQLCGREDIPVFAGAAAPLVAELMTTEDTHGPLGVGYAQLPTPTVRIAATPGPQAWIEAADAADGELVGLVTGPLTTLALAIRQDPTLPSKLRRLVIMGGAFRVHGNTTPTAEWNIAVDPEAAAEVFEAFGTEDSPTPIVCPLDITERIALEPDHVVRLIAAAETSPVELLDADDEPGIRSSVANPVIRPLVDALRFYFEFHHAHDEGFIAHVHDAFAALVALTPAVARTYPAHVRVEVAGDLTRATTVADERGMWGGSPNAAIATETDVDGVFAEIIEAIGGLARRFN